MTLQLVRFETTADSQADVDAAIELMFAAIADAAPDDIHYLALRESAEPRYQLMLRLDEGAANPLPGIPAAARFREQLASWTRTPRPPQDAVLLGSYRFS